MDSIKSARSDGGNPYKGVGGAELAGPQRVVSRLVTLLAFIIVLGAGYLLSKYIEGTIRFPFTIAETGVGAVFKIRASDVFEIVTWSFGLVVAGYLLVAVNIETWERHALLPSRKRNLLSHAFVVAALLIAGGNVVHVFFNQFNGMVDDLAGESIGAWNLFVLVYFIDEHISHAMIHIGILLVLAIVIASEPVAELPGEATRVKATVTMAAMLLGFVMGALQLFAAVEGQAGLVVLVGSWAMLVTSLAVHYKRGGRSFDTLRPFERPYIGFLFCFVVAATIAALLWSLIAGLWPAYPFFAQPEEVF
ncbi:MAG: hypothetical protein JW839_06870 [Candidatus Lokiarchaeota archaeon]|nr:hypothetical protein [Candidatus Lokiarchaeota archaeon]